MSLDFNGTSSEVVWPVTALLRLGGSTTMAAWIRADTLKVCGIINDNKSSSTHRGLWFAMNDTTGFMDCDYGDNGGNTSGDRRSKVQTAGTAITTGVWYHVACWIIGSTSMGIYVNGTDQGGTYSGSGAGSAYNTSVGGRIGQVGGSSWFDGLIAEAGYWDAVLTDAEIMSLARGVSPKKVRPAALAGHWPLWNASDPSIDLSGNSLESATMTAVSAANHAPVGCPYPLI